MILTPAIGSILLLAVIGILIGFLGVILYSRFVRQRQGPIAPSQEEVTGKEGLSELSSEAPDIPASVERPSATRKFRCFECGKIIRGGKSKCPKCGAKQRRCMVCRTFIGQEELYTKCSHCKQLAHRSHLLEWIKVNGTCPYCKGKLRVRDVT